MQKFISGVLKKINGSYWLKSGSYIFINRVAVTIFGFVNFFILIRVLSKEDFGAWVLFISVTTLLELVKHGFVRNPLIRYLAMSEDKESPSIQTASMVLNTVVGVLEVAVLVLCAFLLSDFWDSPQLKDLFLIYIVTTSLLVPINHFDVIQQARMQFKGTLMSNLFRHLGLFLFIVGVHLLGYRIELNHLAYAQMASIFLSGFISLKYARPYLQFSKHISWRWFKELRTYGFFTFGTSVSSMINKSIDSWMLGKLISPAAVTIFHPALRIANLVEVPQETLTSIMFPKLSERIASEGPEAARYLYEKAVGTITAFMLPTVLFCIILADPIIYIVAGPGFEQTVPILQITMLYGLIIPFNRFLGITLDAIGKAKTNFLFVLRNAIINVVSNYFFISHFGIIGAAYGTLTTYIIITIINQIYLQRFLGVRIKQVFRHFREAYAKVFFTGIRMLKAAF